MFSRFKTLKDILTAKNLEGDDAIAQRAVVIIQETKAVKERAYYAGHQEGYVRCDQVIVWAALALGGLDRTHRYAFLNDVNELGLDARLLADANQDKHIGTDEANMLVTHAEAAYDELDEEVPVPAVIIKGLSHQFIYRGAHYDAMVATMPPAANSNVRGLRTV